ncbi:MAG: hypothetical protein ACK4ML_06185 [Alishewanella aestuarii]
MFVEPVILQRDDVRLKPLALEHEAGLQAAAADGELWQLRVTSVPTAEDARGYIERAHLQYLLSQARLTTSLSEN